MKHDNKIFILVVTFFTSRSFLEQLISGPRCTWYFCAQSWVYFGHCVHFLVGLSMHWKNR